MLNWDAFKRSILYLERLLIKIEVMEMNKKGMTLIEMIATIFFDSFHSQFTLFGGFSTVIKIMGNAEE